MREILFRGKFDYNGQKWVYGYLVHGKEGVEKHAHQGYYILEDNFVSNKDIKEILYYCMYKVIHKTIGQYTGLQDKNGVKIFEGDIIEWIYCKDRIVRSVVVYDNEWSQFCVHTSDTESFGVNKHLSKDIVVIGNIHDNPELLNQSGS